MNKAILGKKIGMTQVFTEEGHLIPVTIVEAGPCTIVQVKNLEKDGYNAVQLGFGHVKERRVTKPIKGHFDKDKIQYKRYLKEFRLEDNNYQVGQEIKADIFTPGEKVDVSGISKGKGFAGVIKRWNQSRGPMSHGSKFHRRPGAMAMSATPARVLKGKKLPGQMGHELVTVQNLEVVKVDGENNLLLIKGAVPGPKNTLLSIKETVKVKK